MSAKKAYFDTLRSLAFGGISAAYAAIGTPLDVVGRIIVITNNTDAALIISDDDTNADGQLFLPAGGFKLFDLTSNMVPEKDDGLFLAVGTQFYAKQLAAPTEGSVYIEIVYG